MINVTFHCPTRALLFSDLHYSYKTKDTCFEVLRFINKYAQENPISTNNIPDKHLRAAVTMCQTNPSSVIFVIYKSYENSILMLFGEKPYCIRLEGSKLENLMDRHSKEDYTYLFTYVK